MSAGSIAAIAGSAVAAGACQSKGSPPSSFVVQPASAAPATIAAAAAAAPRRIGDVGIVGPFPGKQCSVCLGAPAHRIARKIKAFCGPFPND